jgi:1-phosphofructokinase/tagatose 6-phosphate kinase
MITVVVLNPAVDKTFFVSNFYAGGHYRIKNENIVKSAGGKGINVSRVAAILGEKVTAVGFKAGDTGEWLESQLSCLGVDTRFITVGGQSRTTINIIDKSSGTETEVIEKGPEIQGFELDKFLDAFKQTIHNTRVLVCTGGLPEGIPADIYRTLIEIARPYGIKTILDASNEVLKEGIKAQPDLVKPNLRELSKYTGRELKSTEDILQSCRNMIDQGARIVVASLGREGALMVTGDTVLHSKPPEVEAVNAIGSGDSMIAGFAASMLRGYPLTEAFKLGMACGVANTQFMEVGLIDSELVEKYAQRITVDVVR